jgi:hypothetical protein
MRITGSDKDGQDQLGNFIDPESKYPVLVTTSRLLSTGVDAQTCRLIVLDRAVGSMTEFKQIVGRGTRVHEDTKKFYFTLIDFRGATAHFADPDFDGDPVQIYEPGEGDPITPPDDVPPASEGELKSLVEASPCKGNALLQRVIAEISGSNAILPPTGPVAVQSQEVPTPVSYVSYDDVVRALSGASADFKAASPLVLGEVTAEQCERLIRLADPANDHNLGVETYIPSVQFTRNGYVVAQQMA